MGTKRPCTHHRPIQGVSSKGSLDEPTNAGLPARITSIHLCCNRGDECPTGPAIYVNCLDQAQASNGSDDPYSSEDGRLAGFSDL